MELHNLGFMQGIGKRGCLMVRLRVMDSGWNGLCLTGTLLCSWSTQAYEPGGMGGNPPHCYIFGAKCSRFSSQKCKFKGLFSFSFPFFFGGGGGGWGCNFFPSKKFTTLPTPKVPIYLYWARYIFLLRQVVHQPGTYPGFLLRVANSSTGSPLGVSSGIKLTSHLYTWVDRCTMRVTSVLPKNTIQCPSQGLNTDHPIRGPVH